MCHPVIWASLAISAVSAYAEGRSADEQAKNELAYRSALQTENVKGAVQQMQQLRIQEGQQNEAAAGETEKARQASQRARASSTTAAAEAGVEGPSIAALLQEHKAQFGQYKAAIDRQSKINKGSISDSIEALKQSGYNQNLSLSSPVYGANWGALGLKVAGDTASSYAGYKYGNPGSRGGKAKIK